jgi:hypothetical protein
MSLEIINLTSAISLTLEAESDLFQLVNDESDIALTADLDSDLTVSGSFISTIDLEEI